MWIRSQNKNKLLNVQHFELDEDFVYALVQGATGLKYVSLGKYGTKEKALEVLNQIQNYLVACNEDKDMYSVFEMPKE